MGGDPPKRISQLSQDVVDKIAAGEVVVRPMNVVKELIENSLDAAATEITVSVGGGGMQMIRVQVSSSHQIMRSAAPTTADWLLLGQRPWHCQGGFAHRLLSLYHLKN